MPYDSLPAFEKAFDKGSDVIKGDFRVNADNTGMVMHSSPIEYYESIPCGGKKVELMSTKQCESCRMLESEDYFISAPELLTYGDQRINVMFCVKLDSDIPRAISTLIETGSTHRAFLEVGLGPFLTTVQNKVRGWDQVYFIIEINSPDDVQTLIAQPKEVQQRSFLIEFNNWDDWNADARTSSINQLHVAGMRTLATTKNKSMLATVENHLHIFEAGFDVVYTYNLENAVTARVQVNTERGLYPA
jgi:glycerophosphoryl diester phosphodiesterase